MLSTTLATRTVTLLSKRLQVWDTIDRAYDAGMISEVIQLEKYIDEHLTPAIRRGYSL